MTINPAVQPNPWTGERTGGVLVAVHPSSRRLDAVIARGVAQARATNSHLVFLTVAENRPVVEHLNRMRARLRAAARPVDLIVTWIDGEAPRHQRPDLIAAEIVAAATRIGATAVVVGHDPTSEPAMTSVVRRLVATLPSGIELCLGTEPALADEITDAIRPSRSIWPQRIERRDQPAAGRMIHAAAASAAGG